MSKEDLWIVIGRSGFDLDFSGQLLSDFEKTIKDAGYELDPDEIEDAKQAIHKTPSIINPVQGADLEFQQDKMKERLDAQVKRMIDLGQYTVKILKDTLDNATYTYRMITRMSTIMFATGIGLFIFAAIYGAVSEEKIYSLVFGGLGALSFVAFFILSPIDKAQIALSNLVQVEVIFMNYFEQITFWENFALTPKGTPPAPDAPDLANIEKASAMLQERSQQTVLLLEEYVEEKHVESEARESP